MSMTQDEIFEKVRGILTEALGVDDDEVTPQASLVADLGAESIDFLDIVFQLEKAFNVKIGQGEMFPESALQDERYVHDGKVTDQGMAELKSRMPFADFSNFESDRSVEKVPAVVTVDSIVKFMQGKLAA